MAKLPDQDPSEIPGVRFPPPLVYIIVFVAGLQLQRLFPIIEIPRTIGRPVSAVCLIAAAILAASSFTMFRRARTSPFPFKPTTALVTNGPYRFSRNPMYLSLALLYVGLALWLDYFWVFVLVAVAIVLVHYLAIVREEQYLEQKFGREYLSYKARVRRWITFNRSSMKLSVGSLNPGAINMSKEPHEPDETETGSAWKNIGKTIFLIAALVAAWFVLERLMGNK